MPGWLGQRANLARMVKTMNSPAETVIPCGAPLLNGQNLAVQDIEQMLENLLEDGFVGVVELQLASVTAYFVLRDGTIVRALEADKRGNIQPRLPARLYSLLHQKASAETSVYVMSEGICSILASSFAFSEFMPSKRIAPKELKGVLSNIESQGLTGFMIAYGEGEPSILLFEDGHILTERFAERYGDIVCGAGMVSTTLDQVHQNGSQLLIRGEKAEEISARIEASNADLARIRPMSLKKASALFRSAEEVKLSEDVFREWGLDPKSQFEVELETADGRMFSYKCKSGSTRLGTRVEVHSNMLKTMGVSEGEMVNVRPQI